MLNVCAMADFTTRLKKHFAELAQEFFHAATRIESQMDRALQNSDGDFSPALYQVAIANYSASMENSAKWLIAKADSVKVFQAKVGDQPLTSSKTSNYLSTHRMLGFKESLDLAAALAPSLNPPIGSKLLRDVRNFAIHSAITVDKGRLLELSAVAATHFLAFLETEGLDPVPQCIREEDLRRLDRFMAETKARLKMSTGRL